MLNALGWKDILRPIRDGYRHLFPSPDTGPTPEERRRQRALDQLLKSFTYFDTFDQLQIWTAAEADVLQRSNTPLLQRSQAATTDTNKANVLLCHDYSGNYHDYEATQGIGVDEESYSCEHLQFVDTFVYFSHKLACVPPPSWTNTLHRNGVKVLGTFLIEPQTKDTQRLLERNTVTRGAKDTVTFPMATKLADIARHYGFDGWLVNIEKPFPKETWDPHVLEAFLRQLRDDLGTDRLVIWYDAITIANRIDYQNALTQQNLPYSKACTSILTNYCWKESDASNSMHLARENHLSQQSLFFGVDVWAQNATKLTQPRVTFPEKGGGGTNTGIAVAKLAEIGLSVGVFAPAWSFEHFPRHGRTVERAMWDGTGLPKTMDCSCGNANLRHPTNRGYPITQSARQFPAGSERYFYTDFRRAFGRPGNLEQNFVWGGKQLYSQLASQSILPNMSNSSVRDDGVESSVNALSLRLEDLPSGTQLVVEAQSVIPMDNAADNDYERWLPFFKLDMATNESLQLRILSTCMLHGPNISTSYYLKSTNGVQFFPLEQLGHVENIEAVVTFESEGVPGGRLQEIGIHLVAPPFKQELVRVAEVMEICITPLSSASMCAYSIDGVRVESRGEGETSHQRLCWNCNIGEQDVPFHPGIPYSDVTGPFSYFVIHIDEIEVGRAYALEHILAKSLINCLRSEGGKVSIIGVGFNGTLLIERTMWLKL
ncbi:glycoside hydrolase family 85 protein [Melanomma pulvis-pyrius CBS 109.77]|uniref:Glycoside hydrolase family 85 protein n=1 Tax=Melanomma pulvis-pyrius CBS 109.77 TaxID=1314802 RepID=A0A6A6X0C5_9PLEO|nr:glycoside hydrolase family 85 protein [Melanomma pulvis-pyrius CBS 109.77]